MDRPGEGSFRHPDPLQHLFASPPHLRHPSPPNIPPLPRPAESPLPRRPPPFPRVSLRLSPRPRPPFSPCPVEASFAHPPTCGAGPLGVGRPDHVEWTTSLSVRPPHVQAVRREDAAMARGPAPRRGWKEEEKDDAREARRREERGRGKKKERGGKGREGRKGQTTVDACLAMANGVESWACRMGMEERS